MMLDGSEQGEYIIHTASGSVYLLELTGSQQGGFLTRSPDERKRNSKMLNDLTKLAVVGVSKCVTGESGVFLLGGYSANPDMVVVQRTSKIVRIANVTV